MRGLSVTLTLTLALPGMVVALAALMGLGALRGVSPAVASLVALGVGLLPALGFARLLSPSAARPEPLIVGLIAWPVAVLLGLPAYFPGERAEALATGLAMVAAPWGPEASARAAGLGEAIAGLLGPDGGAGALPAAAQPLAEAAPLVAPAAPPPPLPEDAIALPYEGEGRSLLIPVTFEGRQTADLTMLYDTGATYTTLDSAALASLGVKVPRDAPEITMRTANGERKSRLVLLERVWLGGFEVEGVTVAVCEECADELASGLLGLNVTGRFTVTVDPGRHELVLTPRAEGDRLLDVGQWLRVEGTATAWNDGRVRVDVRVENRAPRPVALARVGVTCGEERFALDVEDLAGGEQVESPLKLPRGTDCTTYKLSLEGARWE